MAEGKTKAPTVDGKRLAKLESSVSALAIALVANGVSVPDGADPVEIAIAALKAEKKAHGESLEGFSEMGAKIALYEQAAEQIAKLKAAIALSLGVEPDLITDPVVAALAALDEQGQHISSLQATIDAGPDGATEGEIAAIARAEAAEKRVAELEEETGELKIDVEELATARNRLANQLAEEGKGQAGDEPELEEPEASPTVARERPDTARDVGPTFGRVSHVELQELVAAGAPLELAFSNGEFELIAFSSPALAVPAADMIRVDSSRYIVGKAVHVKGGDHPEELHGVGLLLEGSQVGYCSFDPPLLLLPGHEWKFDRQLIF